ncbi:MAG: Omp28-related outer membrane protein [Bacteroidales bacterium]|nr:Omp28-related outer membrane protein [Bacteroidales bacterium]
MKKNIIVFGLAMILMVGCDIVEPPYVETLPPSPTDSVVQKVLLEEFTGHLCPNCPEAAEIAHQLQLMYPNQVIVISIHAGYFANLQSPNYMTDYRTSVGNDLHNFFGVSSYPIGMINRIERNGIRLFDKNAWASIIDSMIHTTPKIKISYQKQFNISSSTLQATIEFKILSNIDHPLMWCVFFTEDSLISYQKNNNPNIGPTPEIPNYSHDHVLRGAAFGTWGDTLTSIPSPNGTIINKNLNYSFASSSWNLNHVHLIVFVYNPANYQILQVEKFSLL